MDTGSKSYFEDVASQWDEMRKCFFSDRIREKAYDLVDIEAGKLAADIGAGTGFITTGLIQRGLSVVAVDQSEQMLAEMSAKFAGIPGIEYRVGQAEELPIADNAVDYVFANMYLHHVERPPIAIEEMARILRVGGKLAITDMKTHNFQFLRTDHHDRWLGFEHEDIQNWFDHAGLEQVIVDDIDEKCNSSSANTEEIAEVDVFVAVGAKVSDDSDG